MPASRITTKAAALATAAVLMCASLAACAPKNAGSAQSGAKSDTVTVGLPGSLSTLDTAHETGIINYYVAQDVYKRQVQNPVADLEIANGSVSG